MTSVAPDANVRASATPASRPATSSGRLMSIDALRGFDMFWIIGAGAIVEALNQMHPHPVTSFLSTQLEHVKWEGFHFYDLIFPLFLFVMGVSMVFSLDKALATGGMGRVLWRVVRRSLLLFALGVFYYGGLSQPWPAVQLGGVLQRIAACYLAAAVIYCVVRSAGGLALASAALLLSYWALLAWVPFPDLKLERKHIDALADEIGSSSPQVIASTVSERVVGVYQEGRNLTNYVDFLYLPGKKPQIYYLNEGLLSTLPAIALPLLGAMAGLLLKDPSRSGWRKVLWLLIAGGIGVGVGLAWGREFPIIKRIWTSSFVLLTAGMSAALLGVFYGVVDVLQWRRWCQPFVWIGCNAITIYLLAQIVNFRQLAARLVGGDVRHWIDAHVAPGAGALLIALVGLALALALLRFLYVRQIFVRV